MSKFKVWRLIIGIISFVIGGFVTLIQIAAIHQSSDTAAAGIFAFGFAMIVVGILSICLSNSTGIPAVILGWICIVPAALGIIYATPIFSYLPALICSFACAVSSVYTACAE